MRNASGHQCKVKMRGSRYSRAKQRQRNVQKKWAARAKLLFANKTYCYFSPFSGVAFAA